MAFVNFSRIFPFSSRNPSFRLLFPTSFYPRDVNNAQSVRMDVEAACGVLHARHHFMLRLQLAQTAVMNATRCLRRYPAATFCHRRTFTTCWLLVSSYCGCPSIFSVYYRRMLTTTTIMKLDGWVAQLTATDRRRLRALKIVAGDSAALGLVRGLPRLFPLLLLLSRSAATMWRRRHMPALSLYFCFCVRSVFLLLRAAAIIVRVVLPFLVFALLC